MIIESLDDLNLHDSELIKIEFSEVIDSRDTIILYLDYIEDYQTFQTKLKFLVFKNCWKATLDLNFAVAPPDSIRTGIEIKDSELLNYVFRKIEKLKFEKKGNIRHFYIETNIANSKINIIAEEVLFLDNLELIKI